MVKRQFFDDLLNHATSNNFWHACSWCHGQCHSRINPL
jgi:hypothetical protein